MKRIKALRADGFEALKERKSSFTRAPSASPVSVSLPKSNTNYTHLALTEAVLASSGNAPKARWKLILKYLTLKKPDGTPEVDVNARCRQGIRLMRYAFHSGDRQAMEALLSYESEEAALGYAIEYAKLGNWLAVETLVSLNKASFQSPDENGKTIAQYFEEFTKARTKASAVLKRAFDFAKNKQWSLLYAVINDKKVPANVVDEHSRNFLHYAYYDDIATTILIQLGVPIPYNATHRAFLSAQNNQWNLVRFFLEMNLLEVNTIYKGKTLLDWATEHGNWDDAGYLMKMGGICTNNTVEDYPEDSSDDEGSALTDVVTNLDLLSLDSEPEDEIQRPSRRYTPAADSFNAVEFIYTGCSEENAVREKKGKKERTYSR